MKKPAGRRETAGRAIQGFTDALNKSVAYWFNART